MNRLSCIIVDDEFQNQEVIIHLLRQFFPHVQILGKASSVNEAEKLIKKCKPNLVFLDIEMPGADGFELLRRFSSPNFLVVFTTAHANYIIRAIRCSALDFLLKPIGLKELNAAIGKAIKNFNSLDSDAFLRQKQIEILLKNSESDTLHNEMAVPTNSGINIIDVHNLIRCESRRNNCVFHLKEGSELIVDRGLRDYSEILESFRFVKLQRKNLINLKHVKQFNPGEHEEIVLTDETHIKASLSQQQYIFNVMQELI